MDYRIIYQDSAGDDYDIDFEAPYLQIAVEKSTNPEVWESVTVRFPFAERRFLSVESGSDALTMGEIGAALACVEEAFNAGDFEFYCEAFHDGNRESFNRVLNFSI